MKYLFLVILVYSSAVNVFGQSDRKQIEATIQKFIDGTTYNYPEKIVDAFYPETKMFLYNSMDTLLIMTSETYADLYKRRTPGTKNNRISSIVSIDIVKDVAYAKLQVLIPSFGNRFYDLLLLKKIEEEWKIVSKVTSAEPIPKSPSELIAKPAKEVVLDQLKRPWSMAFLSEEEVIIAEKDGDLLKVNLKTKQREKIIGLPGDVGREILIDTSQYAQGVFPGGAHGKPHSFNAGWFQVLLDPDFDKNNYLYLSYAAENKQRQSTTKVIRGKLDGNRLSEVKTLFLASPHSDGLFHYGGGMIFGEDKKLYITIGERNFYEHLNPEPPLSQDVKDKRGKVIRINRDGSIPTDNPNFGPDAIKGLFATGIRASQGLALHPTTKKIWFSEHGTIQGDEINVLEAGANYGWPYVTSGKYRTKNYKPPVPKELTFKDPVFYWDKTVAPTGLTFYTGRAFPQWYGDLIVPGLSKGSLWRMKIENDKVVSAEELFVGDRVRLRKAIVSPRGQLYLLSDEENGKLIRVNNLNQ